MVFGQFPYLTRCRLILWLALALGGIQGCTPADDGSDPTGSVPTTGDTCTQSSSSCEKTVDDDPQKVQTRAAFLDEGTRSADDAYAYLNHLRSAAGLNELSRSSMLETSAKNHAQYVVTNNDFSHDENPENADFTGIKVSDRANHAGFLSRDVAEGLTSNASSDAKMLDDLMSAIYHRFDLLNTGRDVVGIGTYQDLNLKETYGNNVTWATLVQNMGIQERANLCATDHDIQGGQTYITNVCKTSSYRILESDYNDAVNQITQKNPDVVIWPADNATVPPVFYEETPDPLPECSVSGYPVTVQINPQKVGDIVFIPERTQLKETVSGEVVPLISQHQQPITNLTDPDSATAPVSNEKEKWLAFFPQTHLPWNTQFTFTYAYTDQGVEYTKESTFYTPELSNVYTITENQTNLNVPQDQTFYLFVQPKNCNDIVSNVNYIYNQSLSISYDRVNNNTISISTSGTGYMKATLDDDRIVEINVQ